MTMAQDKFRYNMSGQEAEIVVMARGGATNKMMAGMLGITEKRLEALRKSAIKKQKLAKSGEMSKPRKYKLVFWVKSADRAVGIIDRLWAVGELSRAQRDAMVAKIDDKKIIAEQQKNKKFDFLFAQIRQFYTNNGTERQKKGERPC